MRTQTNFGKIAAATNQSLFGFFFIAIRLLIGVSCLLVPFMGVRTEVSPPITCDANDISCVMATNQQLDEQALTQIFTPISLVVGIAFLLGIFIRPVGVLAGILVVYAMVSSGTNNPLSLLPLFGTGLLFGLFAAGGAGHAFGLNGIILRNIRRPGKVANFLFG